MGSQLLIWSWGLSSSCGVGVVIVVVEPVGSTFSTRTMLLLSCSILKLNQNEVYMLIKDGVWLVELLWKSEAWDVFIYMMIST